MIFDRYQNISISFRNFHRSTSSSRDPRYIYELQWLLVSVLWILIIVSGKGSNLTKTDNFDHFEFEIHLSGFAILFRI